MPAAEVALAPGALVVGDLHLDVFGPDDPGRFAEWVRGRLLPARPPRLVVLGDLFEYWVGRGQEREPGARVALDALLELTRVGTAVDVLHGNRDFLLGPGFERATGARVHRAGLVGCHPDGGRTLFLHGDELCTADRRYRAFRAVVRSAPVRLAAHLAPLGWRRAAAGALRRRSGAETARKPLDTVALQPETAAARARAARARALVCGHAHRFRDEELSGGAPAGVPLRWLVVDAWGGPRDGLRLGEDGRWSPWHSGGGDPTLSGPPTPVGDRRRMIVAIDGPAASGKSTVARALAARLGLTFLDTGAMYRAVTLVALERGIDPHDGPACAGVAAELDLSFDDEGRIRVDGAPGEPRIRGPRIDAHVSVVAAHPEVRRALVPKQREIARRGAVAEGRDTTTVVFPTADHKFFLTASPRERARRRALQEGTPEREGEIAAALERRDRLDSGREDSPLRQGDDVVLVETDGLTAEEIVDRLAERVLGVGRP